MCSKSRWLQQDHCDRKQSFRITLGHPQVPCRCLQPVMAICSGTSTHHSFRLSCSFGITTFRGENKKLCLANAVLMARAGSFTGLLNRRGTEGWCLPSRTLVQVFNSAPTKANRHLKWWNEFFVPQEPQANEAALNPQWLLHWILHSY